MFSQSRKLQIITLAFASFVCACMSGVCLAQPDNNQTPRPQRSGNEEFWNVLNSAVKEANNNGRSFWRLLEHADVQNELGLDESEFKAMEQLNLKNFEELKSLREKYKSGFDKDAVKKVLVEVVNRQDAEFVEQIAKDCNLERLIQIDVQVYDVRAVTHAEVARRVGISADKQAELRCLSDQIRREEMESIGDVIQKELRNRGPNSRGIVRQLFAEIDKKVNDSLRMKLTSQELENLQQLRGKPFAIPEDLFEPRRRGGRGQGAPRNSEGDDKDRDKNRSDKENCFKHFLVFNLSC